MRETGNPDGEAQGDALLCSAQAGRQALRGLQKGQDHLAFRRGAPVGEYLVREEEGRGPQDAEHGLFRIGLILTREANTLQNIYQYRNLPMLKSLTIFVADPE